MNYSEVLLLIIVMICLFVSYVQEAKIRRMQRTIRRHNRQLKEPVQLEIIEYAEHDLNERW